MKLLNISLFITLFFHFQYSSAQVENGDYSSSQAVEYSWSSSQNQYILVETVSKTSLFRFTESYIAFNKFNTKWKSNKWAFYESETDDDGYTSDIYFDERDQKVVILYDKNELWYYWSLDLDSHRYRNLTIYKYFKKRSSNVNTPPKKETTSSRFRRDYNVVAFYDSESDKWSEWDTGANTFVMNYNDNGDIAHYKANGEFVLYKKISGIKEDYANGEHYQLITALDEDGYRFQFQFFDDPSIGLKLIYGDIMIQFAKH